jgi:hypothetical protein
VAKTVACPAYCDAADLINRADAVSVVVPTSEHYRVAKPFLEAGVHVLLEKPITSTLPEADGLIEAADRRGVVLQIGHLERFNPAMSAALTELERPLFIEADRVAPYQVRGTDVDVVLDLMIHDIDIALHLIGSQPVSVNAVGMSVVTSKIDIANARLEFANGAAANFNASRIADKTVRKVKVFQRDSYVAIDFGQAEVYLARQKALPNGGPPMVGEMLTVTRHDALEHEIRSFVDAIDHGRPPVVSGRDGRHALKVALDVIEACHQRLDSWLEKNGSQRAAASVD